MANTCKFLKLQASVSSHYKESQTKIKRIMFWTNEIILILIHFTFYQADETIPTVGITCMLF